MAENQHLKVTIECAHATVNVCILPLEVDMDWPMNFGHIKISN